MRFNEHGNYEIKSNNDIIFLTVSGVWNIETSIHCIETFNSFVEQIDADKFSGVVDTQELRGMGPDSVELWQNTIVSWEKQHLNAVARIDRQDSISYKIFLAGHDVFLGKPWTSVLSTHSMRLLNGFIHWDIKAIENLMGGGRLYEYKPELNCLSRSVKKENKPYF